MTYKMLTFDGAGAPRAGMLIEERVYALQALAETSAYGSWFDVLQEWPLSRGRLDDADARLQDGGADPWLPLDAVRLLAPLLYPGEIYGAGANYKDHVVEMAAKMNVAPDQNLKELGEKPFHFIKTSRATVVGPGAVVPLPGYSKEVDWEVELAAVIGQFAHDVQVADALDHVAGFTIANDLSVRDKTRRRSVPDGSPNHWDRLTGKCFPGSCPLGPWIVPAGDIVDPQNLALKLWVNDELRQDSNTNEMIFSVAEQIAMLSSRTTLFPGDVVLTGTPAGVGVASGTYLKAGDVVRMQIQHIGEFTHSMAAPSMTGSKT